MAARICRETSVVAGLMVGVAVPKGGLNLHTPAVEELEMLVGMGVWHVVAGMGL